MKDDLIKRFDAIGAITNHCENECYFRVDNWCPQCQREEFEEAIKAIPSADRPQGEWIEAELDKGFRVCSVCKNKGYKDKMAWRTDFIKAYLNYCPNCGARMKGADDE